MKKEKQILPTITKLMEEIGFVNKSVMYQRRRIVLTRLDFPILAYGLGYAGFIAAFKTKQGKIDAIGYSIKNIQSRYPEASFFPMETDKAIEMIKTNKLFIKKYISKDIDKYKKRTKQHKPVIGRIVIKYQRPNEAENREEYMVQSLKNGKYWIYKINYNRYRINLKEFMRTYLNIMAKKTTYIGYRDVEPKYYKVEENTLKDEDIEKIKILTLMEEI